MQSLRDEAAAGRVRAKRADDAEGPCASWQSLRRSHLLMAPGDLHWSDALADEHGFPDEAKIRAAAEDLIAARPYWRGPAVTSARVRGATP